MNFLSGLKVSLCPNCGRYAKPDTTCCEHCGYDIINKYMTNKKAEQNSVASGLSFIGFISIVAGVICLLGYSSDNETGLGLVLLLSGIISGTMFFGFAEIINLLQQISKKLSD